MSGELVRVAKGPSIHDFIISRLDASGRLEDPAVPLPDEFTATMPKGLKWAAGAMDGATGHHVGGGASQERGERAAKLFYEAAQRPTKRRLKKLYSALIEDSALDYIDPMIERLVALESDVSRTRELGRWLVTTSADRGPAKVGLAILGISGLEEDLSLVLALGSHEEFTLYAAVAIRNGVPNPDRELWKLAQAVNGWGRIECVDRLRETTDPEIRSWILRTGFRNSIMNEYLAYAAANTGGLLEALREDAVDRELLTAAGEIISALVEGGPAEDLDDYVDGADAVEMFMVHMLDRAETLDDFHAVASVEQYLAQSDGWDHRSSLGWTEDLRQRLEDTCREVLDRRVWDERIEEALRSEDSYTAWQANQAARIRGIDTFELHIERITKDPLDGPWYDAWVQADEPRAQRLAALARRTLPLDEIATGLGDDLGFGPEWKPHRALDWSLQALKDYPGLGGDLLMVGLRSPVTRNRNLSLSALAAWPEPTWPDEAAGVVRRIADSDPNEQARQHATDVLIGNGD